MKLFVGLGNPGAGYARNRHNVGFMALDRIASRHGFGPWRKKFSGHACDGAIDGVKIALLKPETFMNDSGRAVGEAVRFHKVALGDVVVFHDELDLAPGKLRVKTGGGNAGHNGLRSISALVGNETQRVRIGIGHPGVKELVHGYVLHDFAKADQAWLEPLLGAMADAAGQLAAGDAERFLTDVARALQSDGGNATPTSAKAKPEPPPAKPARHPAGERGAKQKSAIAENLKKWMAARRRDD